MSARRSALDGLGARIVRALAAAHDGAAAAEVVLAEVARALGSPLAFVWLLDERTGLLRYQHDWGDGPAVDEVRRVVRRLSFAPGVGLPGEVLERVVPAWIEDIASDSGFPRDELARAAGMRSVLAVPLVAADGPIGVMELFRRTPGTPAAADVEEVATAGRQLAAYLGRLRVEDRLRTSEESGASIVHAALDCIITMDHRGRVVDFNPAAEATFGYTRDAAVGERLADLIIPPELRDAHEGALERYVTERRATILGRRLELVAMRAGGGTFPCELTVTRLGTTEPPMFAGFVRDITDRRTAEAELARLLARERQERERAEAAEHAAREVAETLQQTLLPPHLPEIPGLELGAAYRGGTAGWHVGGDFYDVFKLERGRWAIAIGDVCGKGARAAALTAKVRYALHHAAVREESPALVVRAVNDELLREEDGEFCTAIFAVLDVRGDRPQVCMTAAGHPPPLIVDAAGLVTDVAVRGPLLGAFARTEFEDVSFTLSPGALLLLYTDGVTEAATPDGRFGEPRLAALLAESARLHPQTVADRIDHAVCDARLPGAGDDVAVLAVRAR